MIQNASRIGNFTSSEIAALMTNGKEKGTFGKPALTYIEECNMERRLGRSVTEESTARPLMWGKLNEKRVFEMLGLEYTLCSQETIVHPEINCWSGSPDGEKFDEGKTVIDFKCPITLKSFCQLVDPVLNDKGEVIHKALTIEAVRENHRDGEKYYWQLVSNAILTGAKYAELIVYVPYQSELQSIRDYAANLDGDQRGYYWLSGATDDELPYLIEGGLYKNINIIRFEIPESDKRALTGRVRVASERLIKV
jgi:hypothetical protein